MPRGSGAKLRVEVRPSSPSAALTLTSPNRAVALLSPPTLEALGCPSLPQHALGPGAGLRSASQLQIDRLRLPSSLVRTRITVRQPSGRGSSRHVHTVLLQGSQQEVPSSKLRSVSDQPQTS